MKRIIKIFSILFMLHTTTEAEFISVGNIKSYNKFPNRIEFILENTKFNIYVYNDNVIRFRYTNKEKFSEAPSYAVIYDLPARTNFVFNDEGNYYSLMTKELTVRINKSPCRISIYDSGMNLLNEDDESLGVCFDNNDVRCFKNKQKGEKFYGLGEKPDSLNKTGKEYTLWNTDNPNYNSKSDELYQSIPFFYGITDFKAYGIFFDNTYKSHFNFCASNNRFSWFGAEGGEMDYYFIYGPEIKKVIGSYTKLTGRQELPPIWALGYQQSRWSYYPEKKVKTLATLFRLKKIPCDVIYLDIDYMDDFRVFTWDKEKFPQPSAMMNDLKSNGFKIITIIDPGVKADSTYFAANEGKEQDLFVKYPDGKLYEGEIWPSWSYFPDFTKYETRIWWGEKLSLFLKDGVEGFWNDMNEPAVWGTHFPDIVQFDDNGFKADHKKIHNVYALEMAKATREGLRKYSDRRHPILTRAGFAGIQRYSAVWTGDNTANEEHLKIACIMCQNLGISGLSFVGSDVGGFSGSPSENLYIRWMQLGAFTPFFRQHSATRTIQKEPWSFGKDAEATVRDIITLRYRLLPYLYNEFYVSSQTGLPVMRPMFLNYQNEKDCYTTLSQEQFMLGENLLVSPILSEKDKMKQTYLPEGNWYEINTSKIYEGGQIINIDAPINMIPYFIREGGMIPMQEAQQFAGEKKIEQTEVLIYPAKRSTYTLYEDDGITYEYEKGKYSLTKFICSKENNVVEITVNKEKETFKPDRKNYLFKVISEAFPEAISFEIGSETGNYNFIKSLDKLKSETSGYYFNIDEKIIYIKTPDTGNLKIKFTF